jgi:murein DD-endopeptidase MepM/ murein hydrolase activator NlpD
MNRHAALSVAALGLAVWSPAQRLQIDWPTPQRDWMVSIDRFVQPTVSGDPESGLFGCVRTSGTQFHEGLDIRPTRRDARGEPLDRIVAAMDGVVRHVSAKPGASSYGRYVVLEHPDVTPAVYTLYAHLSAIDPGIRPGVALRRGQEFATMGRSAGGYAIPKERAHLHFEIGLRATDNFQFWYLARKFGSPNEHGAYNGMNLLGIDPLDFMREWRRGRVDNLQQYFDRLRPAVRVRVATGQTPDFIRRYPGLLRKQPGSGPVGGWEIECAATGLPFAWTPLSPAEVAGQAGGTAKVVWADQAMLRGHRCKNLVRSRGGRLSPGGDLETLLQQVFGIR